MLKKSLEHEGFEVETVLDTTHALEILDTQHVDLMIMDVLIADEYGPDVCYALRKKSSAANLPIIMMSAQKEAREQCLDSGANEFLEKPFSMDKLKSIVKALIH